MSNINFNNLEYNLYELLNLNEKCTIQDIKKQFRKIVKKFHPDKISKLEEKIYYNITVAHQILSNDNTKQEYDNWLNNKNQDFNNLKSDFKSKDVESYFPKTKKEASIGFMRDSEVLLHRHGSISEDNRDFSIKLSDFNNNRDNLKNIRQEHYKNTDEFNDTFDLRKQNGEYSDKIIKYENENIVPYEHHKNSIRYVDLKDFNKLYVEDTVQTGHYTSLNRAFSLQPFMKNTKTKTISDNISNYKIQTEDLKNLEINL